MCCMNSSGLAASEESAAGYWGDYRVAATRNIQNIFFYFMENISNIEYLEKATLLLLPDIFKTIFSIL